MSAELSLSYQATQLIHADVRAWGQRQVETGGFLLADGKMSEADMVALAGKEGVIRRRDCFRLSGEAVDQLFTWAGERGLRILAQVHSHRRTAFLSRVDLDHGFSVERFVSSVVPNYAAPPLDPSGWSWWRFSAGTWSRITAPATVGCAARVVTFDAEGVDDR
jgi:hypothetical protein